MKPEAVKLTGHELAVNGARRDVVIAMFCIEHGFRLLHQDRDFNAMAEHVGLRVL